AMRLSAAGRPAEYLPDPLSQQIAARNLDEHSVCLVLSGSGANEDSLAAAAAARTAGAAVLVVTSFSRAPLVGYADTALVIPPVGDSFPDELMHQSRAALALVLESLMKVLVLRRGERGVQAREAALPLIEKRLSESRRGRARAGAACRDRAASGAGGVGRIQPDLTLRAGVRPAGMRFGG